MHTHTNRTHTEILSNANNQKKKQPRPQTQKITSEIFCALVTDVTTVWVPAGGIRKEKSTNGIGKCTCRRYRFDLYQAK